MARTTLAQPRLNFVLLLNRVSMGLYFLIAGVNKLRPTDEAGLTEKLSAFAAYVVTSAPSWLPEALARAYGYALPFAEILAGALVVIGLAGRWAAAVMSLILVSITAGHTGLTDEGKPFHANVVFLTLVILLAVVGPGRISLDAAFGRRRTGT